MPYVTAEVPACFTASPRRRDGGAFVLGCGASGPDGLGMMPGMESTRIGREGDAVVGPYAIIVIGTKAVRRAVGHPPRPGATAGMSPSGQ